MADRQDRIEYLDGLRGIAILLVIFYHYCGPVYAGIVHCDGGPLTMLVAHGWVGVQLFFLISGFVILMTLDKCRSISQFLYNRWIRLFPAMLIATGVLVLFNVTTHIPGPHPMHSWIDAIPGLIFIPPAVIHAVTHVDIHSLDGVFWTLYTEAGFYVVFGVAYFVCGWRVAIAAMVVLAAAASFGDGLLAVLGASHEVRRMIEPLGWMNMQLYAWFASGALFWKAREYRNAAYFNAALVLGIATALLQINYLPLQWLDRAALVIVVILFATAQVSRSMQTLLAARITTFFGFVSYPLYLLHNEIGVSLIGWANAGNGVVPPIVVVALVAAGAVGLAWLVARHVEPAVRRTIRRGLAGAGTSRPVPNAAVEI